MRKGPPPPASILGTDLEDPLYDAFGLLDGPKGLWHRLWATIMASHSLGSRSSEAVDEARAQFEHALGRKLRESEMQQLHEDAIAHAEAHLDSLVAELVRQRRNGE